MDEILKYSLLETENLKITVFTVVGLLLVVFGAFFLSWLIKRFLKRRLKGDVKRGDLVSKIFRVLNLAVWLAAIGAVIALILDQPFSEFLEAPLIDTDNFELKPIHFFMAAVVIIVTRLILMSLDRIFTGDSIIVPGDAKRKKNVLKVFSYIIWVAAALLILDMTGLKLTVIWGAGAALLVGIGFGLQQIFADLISGVFLLFEGNLNEGDVVELDNGTVGKVTFIGARTSKVKTRDNVVLIIPNSHFISQEVINWSAVETQTRFKVKVGVAYGSDVRLVGDILLACAKKHSDISLSPSPFVRFEDFGESSLDFSLYFWSSRSFEVENIKSDLRFDIDAKFRENNIQIPFPQRDVHIISNK